MARAGGPEPRHASLQRRGQELVAGQQRVRVEREPQVRGLHEPAPSDPPNLRRNERPLRRVDVLDQRVAVRNIELAVAEGHRAGVGDHEPSGVIGLRTQVDADDLVRPVERQEALPAAPHVHDAIAGPHAEDLDEGGVAPAPRSRGQAPGGADERPAAGGRVGPLPRSYQAPLALATAGSVFSRIVRSRKTDQRSR